MKLFVWEYSEDYEGCLAFAIAKTIEEAKELIRKEVGYNPNVLDQYPCEYNLDKPVAFCMSHCG